jgi:hypothetical protein
MISRVSIALLVIALMALAGLQYHWIGEISIAERQRLEVSVRESSIRFAGDFGGEIRSLTNALDLRGGEPDAADIVSRYRNWEETAETPELLKALYLVRSTSKGDRTISQVDLQGEKFVSIDWPEGLFPLQSYLQGEPGNGQSWGSNPAPRLLPHVEGTSAVLMQLGSSRPPELPRGRGFDGRPDRGFDPALAAALDEARAEVAEVEMAAGTVAKGGVLSHHHRSGHRKHHLPRFGPTPG